MPSHAIPQRRTVQAHPLMREAITGNHRPSQAIKHVVPSKHVRAADVVHAARVRFDKELGARGKVAIVRGRVDLVGGHLHLLGGL